MSQWKTVSRFVVNANNKFIGQYITKEKALEIANKYKAKGYDIKIKEVEVETMSVSFGVI